jgi:hypothetical protein
VAFSILDENEKKTCCSIEVLGPVIKKLFASVLNPNVKDLSRSLGSFFKTQDFVYKYCVKVSPVKFTFQRISVIKLS